MLPEEALALLKSGGQGSTDEIYEAVYAVARSRYYIFAKLCNRHQAGAEDLLMNTIEQVVTSLLHDPRPLTNPPAYITTAASRLAGNAWKARAVAQEMMRDLRKYASEDLDRTVDRVPDHVDLVNGLATLSEQQVTAVLLIRVFDMTYDDAATEMGISKSTAQTHYKRGIEALRAFYAGAHDA